MSDLAEKLKKRGQERPTAPPDDSGARRLRERFEEAGRRQNPSGFSEVRRIAGLGVSEPLTDLEVEALSKNEILASAFARGARLFRRQAESILAFDEGRLFAPIGVGEGKTLITLMVCARAYRRGWSRRSLLLVPSNVYRQLVDHDIPWARARVPLAVPFHLLGETSSARRLQVAGDRRPGCYVLPYSCLSTKDASEVLEKISPDLVVCDEAHRLRSRRAARTRRLMDFVQARGPRFVPLSGTMTSKSIMDYHHLSVAALGEGSPLPLSRSMAQEWSLSLDSKAQPSSTQLVPVKPILEWARQRYPGEDFALDVGGVRAAYRRRLQTAPGIVASAEGDLGVSLILANLPAKRQGVAGDEDLARLQEKLEKAWLTPTGDEIEHAIHKWKWAYELSAGFYYALRWPEPAQVAERLQVPVARAERALAAAVRHHEVQQELARELRKFFDGNPPPGCDTPLLAGASMERRGDQEVGPKIYALWSRARRVKEEAERELGAELPERFSEPVRVCDYKVRHATVWAQSAVPEGEGALVWYHHREVGSWLVESMRAAGLSPVFCHSGDVGNRAILDPANARKIVVASISAHGLGKNLQAFQHQLCVQWPRHAGTAQQLIGRTHRTGQEADELVVWRCDTGAFDEQNFAACLVDALYVHQTTPTRQKLIIASYDPLPKIFPPEVLRERGFENKMLDAEQRRLLEERFAKAT